jgi:mycobactin peptide synthetase MbtE
MADHAETVQARRRELLRRRIAESGLSATESTITERIRAGQRYPLSPGQRRMWFLQAMDADDVTLNVCVAYRLTGALEEVRLRAAFNDVIARHAILRTVYGVDSEGEPYQVFSDDVEIDWSTVDLTQIPETDREHQVEALARSEFGRPFDLTAGLPLRTTLIHSGADEFVLLFVSHHICWDDDCWAVFFSELSAAYNGDQRRGDAPQFVAVEVLTAAAEPTVADVGYWADSLRPAPEPLQLPGMAATNPSRRAERRTRVVPAELFGRIEEFARARSASPFMVLLAAFGVLVRRYTGATDFLVSVPVTERGPAAAGALGYFGNTLLLRMTPRAQDTFVSFVDAVRETCLHGIAHQAVGIDRVVREVNPERMGHDGMDRLVRLGFSLRKTANEFALRGVSVRQLELAAVAAHLPLALAVVLDPDRVSVEFEYQTQLRPELIDQMLGHYLQLLDRALAEPQHRLTSIDMLGPGERAAVLAQSHGELVATPATTMVALLEAAASETTGAPEVAATVSD